MAVIINKKGLSATVHITANATYTIAGDDQTSNIAFTGETLTGATISQIWYGSGGGHWVVKRGSNTVLVLSDTGHIDFTTSGLSLNIDPTATFVANLNGTANGFLIVEMQKQPIVSVY